VRHQLGNWFLGEPDFLFSTSFSSQAEVPPQISFSIWKRKEEMNVCMSDTFISDFSGKGKDNKLGD
jgi:hypothetical protein